MRPAGTADAVLSHPPRTPASPSPWRAAVVHGGLWLLIGVAVWGQGSAQEPQTRERVLNAICWVLLGALSSAPMVWALRRIAPWRSSPWRSVSPHTTGSQHTTWLPLTLPALVFLVALAATLPWMFGYLWWTNGSLAALANESFSMLARMFVVHVFIMLLWAAGVTLVLAARDVEQAQALQAASQHRLLVAQVNPHFLFNALNSVRALVSEDPERARDMITQLAQYLRGSLSLEPAHRVRLGEELALHEAYFAVEKLRFEERLHVSVKASPEARDAAVPPLLLAPLVENAVTHGRGTPLVVALHAAVENGRLLLTVENSGSWTAEPASGGVGLSNVRDRLALAYGGVASLHTEASDGMVRVRVSLPYTRVSA
jgi:signal transduction histidine kinase